MMKSIVVIVFFSIFVSTLQRPTFPESSTSNQIPQFILDLGNDYIEANRHILALHGNAKKVLCHQESPLRDSLPFSVPDDLFNKLFIDNTRFSTPRRGWQNAQDRLSEILDCPAALESCSSFYVDIYRYEYDTSQQGPGSPDSTAAWGSIMIHPNATMKYQYMGESIAPIDPHNELGEHADAPTTLADLFVDVLTSMPNLQTIEWKGPEGTFQGKSFERMFLERRLSLPTVKNMHLRSNFIFLAGMAPNLEFLTYISTLSPRQSQERYRKQVLEIISDLPSLKSVRLYSSWGVRDFLELYKAVPKLERLEIDGIMDFIDFSSTWWSGEKPVGPEGPKLRGYLRLLRDFDRLKTLELPDPSHIGMHVAPLQGHPFAYEGVLGAKFGRYEAFKYIQKTEQAARIVLEELPNLERLCIGGTCTNLIHDKALRWPWSGRVREYLLNKYSRWNDEVRGKVLIEDPNGPVFFTRGEDRTWLEAGKEPGELDLIKPDRASWLAWDDRYSCVGVVE